MKKIVIVMLLAAVMTGSSVMSVFAGHGGSCSAGDKAACSTKKSCCADKSGSCDHKNGNVKTNFVPGNRA